jgi:adenine-specific DNA-methyltransferase
VLGLIFEKINGYKDGSFFTPGFITMYMCRETIRRAVVQKFNETKNWNCTNTDELYDKIEDRKEANQIVNSIKICDPAVGSGHFLVSALNEMIAIKNDLRILLDRDGKRLKEYQVEVVNDELIVTDEEGELFEYNPTNKESQRIQETLFHEKQTIIENCLFGVDINPNSVKICRLRLWIELLEKRLLYPGSCTVQVHVCVSAEFETLPNIDINIKCGNSLVSRFAMDADLKQALRKSKYTIDSYRMAVDTYRNAENKDQKRDMERLIADIKSDFRSEITLNDAKARKLRKLSGELFQMTNQQQLFEMGKKEKADWNKKLQQLTEETKKIESEIEEIKSNKIFENAFEWRFEFPEVLNNDGDFVGFDVVIGNPPYIRQEELAALKPHLQSQFSTFAGTADLYVYFVELGMQLLRKDGNFIFILPNKWMRAGYGKNLRDFVQKNRIQQIVDFGDLPVFEEATTYPSLLQLQKATPAEQFLAANMQTLNFPSGMSAYIEENKMTVSNADLQPEGWTLTNSKVQKLLAKIRSKGIPLGEYVKGKIYYGIKTGLNEAFVIDQATRDRLVEEDPKSAEIIKPFLAGRDIKRYQQPVSDKYLIFTRRGIKIEDYPAILKHLKQFKTQLTPKPKTHIGEWHGRKTGTYKWYEIQDAVDYYEEFEKEKIMLPDISLKAQSIIDVNNAYCVNTAYIIPVYDYYLLGLLNSSMVHFFYSNLTSTIRGGYLRFIRQYLEQIPVSLIDENTLSSVKSMVLKIIEQKKLNPNSDSTKIEQEIDQLVYELYGLTEEEIGIVEGIT